jgi:carbon monoxide dehydrogenase subunit G
VWAFLSDPAKVATCVPGAQITEKIDESHYKGSISMKVGPAVMDFKGQLEVLKLDPEAHVLEMMGKGQDVRGKGSASMKMTGSLRALPDGGTEVVSVSEVNIVGILAQMGGRIINEVSNIMFQKFTKNFQEKLEQEKQGQGSEEKQPGAAPKPINAVSVAFSALKAAVTRHKTTETQPTPEEKSEQKTQ